MGYVGSNPTGNPIMCVLSFIISTYIEIVTAESDKEYVEIKLMEV